MSNILSYLYVSLFVFLSILISFKTSSVKIKVFTFVISILCSVLILNEDFLDKFLYILLRFIYYPEFNSLLFLMIFLFLFMFVVICSKKFNLMYLGINFIYFLIITVIINSLFYFCSDVYSYNELYSGVSLVLCRSVSISFCIWGVFNTFYIVFFKNNCKVYGKLKK